MHNIQPKISNHIVNYCSIELNIIHETCIKYLISEGEEVLDKVCFVFQNHLMSQRKKKVNQSLKLS